MLIFNYSVVDNLFSVVGLQSSVTRPVAIVTSVDKDKVVPVLKKKSFIFLSVCLIDCRRSISPFYHSSNPLRSTSSLKMQAPNWTDFLSCSVCMSKYNCQSVVPVSLGCCHTLCKRCLVRIKTNTCPYDRTPIPLAMSSYPPNTSLLVLLGYDCSDWAREMSDALSSRIVPESDLSSYNKGREAMEKLSVFLKSFIDQGVLQATSTIPRPVLKKLVTLLSCQILDIEGRGKALRAAHSIAERIITELLIMHQNPQQIPALLWTAVRNRGCQFLGPIMQEEALRLILKVLETGPHLSRKNIVLYVVQQLQSDFPNASKTNIGHVVQLLYRASCFNVRIDSILLYGGILAFVSFCLQVEKREDESSLMQLKEEVINVVIFTCTCMCVVQVSIYFHYT